MNQAVHNKSISFIWSIADDCLRDVYVRGKYRDVILPMVVLRRLDALLEPTKLAVLEELVFQKEEAKFTEWDENGLRQASGYVFYNTSEWTLSHTGVESIYTLHFSLRNLKDLTASMTGSLFRKKPGTNLPFSQTSRDSPLCTNTPSISI